MGAKLSQIHGKPAVQTESWKTIILVVMNRTLLPQPNPSEENMTDQKNLYDLSDHHDLLKPCHTTEKKHHGGNSEQEFEN